MPRMESFRWFTLIESATRQEISLFFLLIRFNLAGLLESLIILAALVTAAHNYISKNTTGILISVILLNFVAAFMYFFTF